MISHISRHYRPTFDALLSTCVSSQAHFVYLFFWDQIFF
jgi:hypothetical protein